LKISIPKWADFQHYKDRRPDWIKVYRHLLENRNWHALSGDAAKLLVEVWLIASESKDGTIDIGTEEVAWRLRKEPDAVARWLLELELGGFVELSVEDAGTHVKPAPPGLCTDPYESVQNRTQRRGEENPRGELEKETPGVGSHKTESEHTASSLAWDAHTVLGMGLWGNEASRKFAETKRIITSTWQRTSFDEVHAAIHGLRIMVDRGDVEWLADSKGKPLRGLEVLVNAQAVIPGPDGGQLRSLFSAAADAYRSEQAKPSPRKASSGPARLHVEIPNDGHAA
jgi:hypothetical protein